VEGSRAKKVAMVARIPANPVLARLCSIATYLSEVAMRWREVARIF
jgi:hypothetical protein